MDISLKIKIKGTKQFLQQEIKTKTKEKMESKPPSKREGEVDVGRKGQQPLGLSSSWGFSLCSVFAFVFLFSFLFSSLSLALLPPSKPEFQKKCRPMSPSLRKLFELEIPQAQKVLQRQKSWRSPLVSVVFNSSCSFFYRWHLLTLLLGKGVHNGEAAKPQTMPLIIRSLKNKDWLLRYVALQHLPHWGTLEAKKWSAKLLSDSSLLVRSQAAKGLSPYLAEQSYRNLLWAELKHPRNWHKGKSLWLRQQILQILLQNPFSVDRQRWQELLAQEKDPLMLQRIQQKKLFKARK